MFSIGGGVPGFDMGPLGAPGCVLRTTLRYQAVAATTTGNAPRGEGLFILPFGLAAPVATPLAV
jgi:hypothetical protein